MTSANSLRLMGVEVETEDTRKEKKKKRRSQKAAALESFPPDNLQLDDEALQALEQYRLLNDLPSDWTNPQVETIQVNNVTAEDILKAYQTVVSPGVPAPVPAKPTTSWLIRSGVRLAGAVAQRMAQLKLKKSPRSRLKSAWAWLRGDTRKLSKREYFWWFVHNMFAHPISEILYWMYLGGLGDWLHEATVPKHDKGEGRG